MAHQLINTSATDVLRVLAVSTRLSPEIGEYPDSGKFGVLAELPSTTPMDAGCPGRLSRPD